MGVVWHIARVGINIGYARVSTGLSLRPSLDRVALLCGGSPCTETIVCVTRPGVVRRRQCLRGARCNATRVTRQCPALPRSRYSRRMRIGYERVSTRDQNHEAQHDALHAAGCERIFIDHASGKLATRPELDKALLVAERAGDQLVVTKLDRLGRSLEHLIEIAKLL